jgi:uncharacterized membrane protein YfcA
VTLAFVAALGALGLGGAFISGLLGVGGAIVMIPLLLYVPPALEVGVLDMKEVAGVTMVQVFVAAVSGMIAHRRHRAVHDELVLIGGGAMAAGTLTGALVSHFVPATWLLVTFALMATAAAVLILTPVETVGQPLFADAVDFNRAKTIAVTLGVGIAAGLVGAGGAFLLVPLLLVVVGIPIRVTVGSSLGIVAIAATAGVVGKLATGQVPLVAACAVALGALPGAHFGAAVSRRLPGERLKILLSVVTIASAARVWWDLLAERP